MVKVNLAQFPFPFTPDQVAVPSMDTYGALVRYLGPPPPVWNGDGRPPLPVFLAEVVVDETVPRGVAEFRSTTGGGSKQITVGER